MTAFKIDKNSNGKYEIFQIVENLDLEGSRFTGYTVRVSSKSFDTRNKAAEYAIERCKATTYTAPRAIVNFDSGTAEEYNAGFRAWVKRRGKYE